ncbi:MAG TPA: Ig-like domain-containing protein [Vicinamibacteria bacterium]|nr:Ig-like domain-containing protein [Vicinamibacteria bacterium]
MRKGVVVLGLVALVPPSAALRAEGVAIDHRPVGCIVAGKHPRLNACFAPSSRLARARVYFRVAGAAPDWYYVEMTAGSPCHAGVLPRPKTALVGRRVQYYVDAFDRSFAESRTSEAEALVVASASECDRRLAVAPVLDGAAVAVFPSLPAGFAGGAAAGLGAASAAMIAVGGAGIVGGGVALAAGGSEGPAETTPTTTAPPATLPPAVTSTTTTTTRPAVGFNLVQDVFRGSTLVTGDTVAGPEPLQLVFDMCRSTGPYRMRFGVWVDGAQRGARCLSTVTFTTSGATLDASESGVRRSVASRTYDVLMTIRSEGPNNAPKADRRLTVTVSSAGAGCTGDTQGPVVSLTKPIAGSVYPAPTAYPVHFEASASDATTGNNGIALVEYKVNDSGADRLVLGPVAGSSPWPYDWTESAVMTYLGTACAKFLDVQAYAEDGCGNATYSSKVLVTVNNTGACVPPDPGAGPDASASTATLMSELGVPGGAGQVVANGEAAFPRTGRSPLAIRLKGGGNRVEATLVEARSGGTWRFDLGGVPGFRPETLRVVAGEVVQLTADSVTFRVQGRPGERVVFAFHAER